MITENFIAIIKELAKKKEENRGNALGRRYAITLTLVEQAYAYFYAIIQLEGIDNDGD